MKKIVALLSLTALLAIFLYGWLIEPQRVTVKYVRISDNNLYNAWGGLRIVHISDIHLTRLGTREERIIRIINGLEPDLVCVTGDLGQWGATTTKVIRFLNSLKGKYGVFVVLGDSDMSSGPQRCFYCHENNNIHRLRKRPNFLRDQCILINLEEGRRMNLCGIDPSTGDDEESMDHFWKEVSEKGLLKKGPILVISHFSRYWSKLPENTRLLWLSGNTHGGQVLIPEWLRPYLFSGKDWRHLSGLFGSGKGKWLYVNQGLGTTEGFPVRIGVPPEITVIHITKK